MPRQARRRSERERMARRMSEMMIMGKNKVFLSVGILFVMASVAFILGCGGEPGINREPGQAVFGDECTVDADCVHMPVCCHRGAADCVPASRVGLDFEERCEGFACTKECRPCTRCVCEDGFCGSVVVGGCC